MLFIRANTGLLYHPRVTIFDIYLARVLLEVGSNLTALIVSFLVFYLIGALDVPRDLPMFYLGYFFMIWWAVAIAAVIGGLSERSDWVEKIWQPFSYLYMFFSGFMYHGRLAAAWTAQHRPLSALFYRPTK